MVQNYEWVKITLNSGRQFFMKDFDWDRKVINQVGQYGIKFFPPIDKTYYILNGKTDGKMTLKEIDTFGFNPNCIESVDIIRGVEVEVRVE